MFVSGQPHAMRAELLASMVRAPNNATSDADLVVALQATSTLSVYMPQSVHLSALHVALAHPRHPLRAAAAAAVSRLLSDIETTDALAGRAADPRLPGLLAAALLDHGILLLLMKSARRESEASAAMTALRSSLDEYAQEYLIAAQSMLALQNARDCSSLLKAGVDAAERRARSTAALLAWAHTRSAHSCPAPPNASTVLFPCVSQRVDLASGAADACLEWHIAYLDCNSHAQSTLQLSPDQASTACQLAEAAARRCDYSHYGYCDWDGTSAPRFSVIKSARSSSGSIMYHAHDLYFRVSLELYGEWAHSEVDFMMQFLPPGATVVDAGSHVGTISLALARQLGPSSTVIAVEASRFFASLARANAAAAGLTHMHVIHAALSNSSGCFMARADHASRVGIANMGGFGVIPCPERVRRTCAARNCALHGETFFDGSGTYEW